LPSSTALVATVVPCRKNSTSAGVMPASAQIASTPVSMPTELSCGVDGVLCRQNPPLS